MMYAVEYPKALHDSKVDESPAQSAFVYDAYNKMKDTEKYTEIIVGSSFTLDGVTVEFLNALNLDLWRENDSSAVMRISFEGSDHTAILLGDIQEAGAARILNRYPTKLKADIVQMAHHALDDLSDLYKEIGASIALAPAGNIAISRPHVQDAIRSLERVSCGTVYDATSSWRMIEILR